MTTTINDLILVYIEENPAFFGRIEDITADIKPGWWHVHIMVLSIPPRMIAWILEDSQINGKGFTMGGIPIRLEKVVSPYNKDHIDDADHLNTEGKVISLEVKREKEEEEALNKNIGDKVISLMDRRKK
ncbi:MAG TPA: hypothetical protein PL110_06735 [Candidatus Eremiobacteraeota bacterium]|nr:MAG: hypothetical protein BWY64_02183 [bacterium ADurb.Bin363]HPZ07790.1 hypothetical protein [Candidatus Eremiobacteraeota bacterium]